MKNLFLKSIGLLVLAISFVSCGGNNTSDSDKESTSVPISVAVDSTSNSATNSTHVSSEGNHEHDHVATHNTTHHWQECECEDVIEKEEHNFVETVTIVATHSLVGEKKLDCECGYFYTEQIPMVNHVYTNNHDETHHWQECECESIINKAEHVHVPSVIDEASCVEVGTRRYECECGDFYDEEIPMTNHDHEDKYDATHHWEECECEDVINKDEHNLVPSVVKEASCTDIGTRRFECECGYYYTEEIPLLSHNHDAVWVTDEENHWHECECGHKANVAAHDFNEGFCTVCGEEYVVATVTVGAETKNYITLVEAILDAPNDGTLSTITLVRDFVGGGCKVLAGQNIVLDLNGYTYSVAKPTVGSQGTETNGFQLLKESFLVIKNGVIDCADDNSVAILIQKYNDLTLENVTIDSSKGAHASYNYALSNNNGSLTIKGETHIIARDTDGVAFDLCSFSTYVDGARVIIDDSFTGTFTGKVEYTYDSSSMATLENWYKTLLFVKDGKEYVVKDVALMVKGNMKSYDSYAAFLAGLQEIVNGEIVPPVVINPIKISYSNFTSGGYAANDGSHNVTINGSTYEFTSINVMRSTDYSSSMQFKKTTGHIYNYTEWPEIKTITIVFAGGTDASDITVTAGDAAGMLSTVTGVSNVYTLGESKFFAIKAKSNGTVYIKEITFTFA